ncbi:flagellin [Bradyrhizobium japonicum]|uniref:Flagellin n=3 Tax=Bradyrhizobium elkanii TaxID=29448 RepID=A0ABV4FGE6_BRAEL|nr:flagellin [Bradyrhizobium elkanii]MBP2430414.1 flagellin-like hook-associated protein FlgL [Bradyrhizobium elkanii]MCP1736245.1 flagellin-like hook-associated protein FlgL [Bradyrhizobium elkanii]MCP1754142.1 flagellin-like hook-associated protein FlgL [Bradyrhizobium elkanii]MCP1979662.1 flagellin-like hook-associated protein FlgL [Bradyrhizobium elkanii]MCS3571586.1 flagellin-like hook-associated protein FlgL [Bradyrhizobium elkanii]
MSGIVLSASVRQNLLSLQSTADLLATTQNRLSTGKKVNTALDNPTNFFTAQSLDNRASDINNLLDGIGNGVQVLQAANTGITSLQKLVDSAKSVANQALQAAVGYSAKSSVTTAAIPGATADNLLGTAAPASNAVLTGTSALATLDLTAAATDLTFKVNSQTVTLTKGASYTAAQITSAINTQVGTSAKVNATLNGSGDLVLTSTNTAGASDAVTVDTFSSGDASQLGFPAGASATASGSAGGSPLSGLTLTIGATGNGTATSITFGTGAGQVKSLNDLNNALSANNLQASLSAAGALTISTTNDAASATIGTIGGTAAGAGKLFNGLTGSAPVQDPTALANRANLVNQYNNILDQITTTAQDASYNGINLLNGDQLKLTFNETGSSTLKIQGVTFDATGLNLTKLVAGTDFVDNASANATLKTLNNASGLLRTQASTLGSNLSIVQIRQDFSKNLINVLQTGSSNLTLADTNEEAANSQALSTRQSIAVSALALANQSQQSVLQLLR